MRKYVLYDTETGGLDPNESSLLTITIRVCDAQLQLLDQMELKLKPNDGVYKVTTYALKVNRINLVQHDTESLSYKEARPQIMAFLARHSDGGKEKLNPIGHNVGFDDSFIQTYLMNKSEWEAYVSYRKLDTAGVGEFLKLCHIIPGSVKGSLGELAQFFGVQEEGAHDATVDVSMTHNLLKAMKNRVSGSTKV